MSVFQNALMFASLAYSVLYDIRFLALFGLFLGFNIFMYLAIPKGTNCNSTRRKIMCATWEEPKEGCIYIKHEIDCTKVQELIKNYKAEADVKPTLTHFGIKAIAQVLNASRLSVNGKFLFGKYIPFKTVDVTCLVDIDGGKDLAAVTIKNCDEKNVIDIAKFIKEKGAKIKKNNGDDEHKKRIGAAQFLPPFVISVCLQLTKYITYYLGMDAPAFGIKKDNFGGATVTSIGMLGIEDAYVPHCNFMNCPVFIALGKCVDKPVVRDGKIVIAPVMNINLTIDHRFIDGGKAKSLNTSFKEVFEHPEKFFDCEQPKYEEKKQN
ncbi:hypothetical protein ABPG72_007546 [Tetrahymena utriculariae]